MIRYLKLLTIESNGTILNTSVMEKSRKNANTSFKIQNLSDILQREKETLGTHSRIYSAQSMEYGNYNGIGRAEV